ncbi:peptide methionine sulfoxide reductase MsrA [Vibrio maritimus]|uniref:peptide-methionine (S)-S-oxide reductase n=1 Tax=Vibrio maritimus TaxID=990268 RepID=A0A090TXL6_9VIBR|nr:peptide methionine sulfoxide reductase MsrA [Vibrio maritimus]
MEKIYFAGGCLWGVQEFMRHLPGVVKPRLAEPMAQLIPQQATTTAMLSVYSLSLTQIK